ncbi:MAG: serine protein kinase [Acidobacteriota bacterium]|nr:MAG: serine protein kinase [Acidobacteriota bacterium]
MLTALKDILKGSGAPAPEEEVHSFPEYLELVKKEPWITRNTFQLLHDMLLSSGVERTIVPGKPIKHRYGFFEDEALVAMYVVFGQQKAKANLVEKIDNASRGLEASKRLWILLGPPGAAKSRSMDGIKTALNVYSSSEEGKTFTLLLPTVDDRLKEKALFEEDGIYYLQAPLFERPLQIIPQNLRPQFMAKLNELTEGDKLKGFFERHPHYDGHYRITVDGLISPFADHVLHEFMKAKSLDFAGMLPFVKVKRMIYDARTKTGIGSYTPRDEKSQEAGSLVGNIDYSLLPRFGSESHPLVHDYKGELCAGANGFVEIHEILKLSDRFLYELLFATQDRFFKPEGQPPVPFNGVIIGHTNFHEYNMFMANETFEALRSRTTFIEMPLSVNFKDEEQIYEFTYANDQRKWTAEKKHLAHVAPHSLEFLSLVAAMTRLYESKQNPNLTLLQKALIYAGRADSGVDNNMARTILEEFEFIKPSEGTFGLDPRFIQNVFENTEHFQINEYAANIARLQEDDAEPAMITSIALQNPCVAPMDLYLRTENSMKESFANNKAKLGHFVEKILPQAKHWILSQMATDVYGSVLRDESVVESTWKKYTDHVRAYVHNTKVKHDVTHADVQPDEKFMQAIEQYLGIAEKDVFRKELSDAIASVSHAVLLADEPSYQSAIRRYVFENEFKSSENIKLLGWIKSGSSAAGVHSTEQEQLNETVKYLMENLGYCGKCAFQALTITASSTSILD